MNDTRLQDKHLERDFWRTMFASDPESIYVQGGPDGLITFFNDMMYIPAYNSDMYVKLEVYPAQADRLRRQYAVNTDGTYQHRVAINSTPRGVLSKTLVMGIYHWIYHCVMFKNRKIFFMAISEDVAKKQIEKAWGGITNSPGLAKHFTDSHYSPSKITFPMTNSYIEAVPYVLGRAKSTDYHGGHVFEIAELDSTEILEAIITSTRGIYNFLLTGCTNATKDRKNYINKLIKTVRELKTDTFYSTQISGASEAVIRHVAEAAGDQFKPRSFYFFHVETKSADKDQATIELLDIDKNLGGNHINPYERFDDIQTLDHAIVMRYLFNKSFQSGAVFTEEEIARVFDDSTFAAPLPAFVDADYIKAHLLPRYAGKAISIGASLDNSKGTVKGNNTVGMVVSKGILRPEFYPATLVRKIDILVKAGHPPIPPESIVEYVILAMRVFGINKQKIIVDQFLSWHEAYELFGGIRHANIEEYQSIHIEDDLSAYLSTKLETASERKQRMIVPPMISAIKDGLVKGSRHMPLVELELRNYALTGSSYGGEQDHVPLGSLRYTHIPAGLDASERMKCKDESLDCLAWGIDAADKFEPEPPRQRLVKRLTRYFKPSPPRQ